MFYIKIYFIIFIITFIKPVMKDKITKKNIVIKSFFYNENRNILFQAIFFRDLQFFRGLFKA